MYLYACLIQYFWKIYSNIFFFAAHITLICHVFVISLRQKMFWKMIIINVGQFFLNNTKTSTLGEANKQLTIKLIRIWQRLYKAFQRCLFKTRCSSNIRSKSIPFNFLSQLNGACIQKKNNFPLFTFISSCLWRLYIIILWKP